MLTGKKILVADDEKEFRTILGDEFRKAGYNVTLAADGDEAIRCLDREKFDLALLDIRMPKIDGLGVLRHITQRKLKTKVIVLTGYADLNIAIEAKQHGAIDFINKPFDVNEVIISVHQALV
jgi:DNA-binding NtrC family response regulator